MSYASMKLQDEFDSSSDDSYRAYGLMLEELEAALEQIASMRAVLDGFGADAEAAIQTQIDAKTKSTPLIGREEEIAQKIEQSLTTIMARLESAADEKEFERILNAADEYLQSLMGKVGKSANRKLLEKLMVLEVTLQAIKEQLQTMQREMQQKQGQQNSKQQAQNIMQALQKNALMQVLENVRSLVQSRIRDISQSAERMAAQNARMAAQKQHVAQSVQVQAQQNISVMQRMRDSMRSMLEANKAQKVNPALQEKGKDVGRISQLMAGIAERASKLIKPGADILMAAQRTLAMQAVILNPASTAMKAQEAQRVQVQAQQQSNVVELANRQTQVRQHAAVAENVKADVSKTQQLARESEKVPEKEKRPDYIPIREIPVRGRPVVPDIIQPDVKPTVLPTVNTPPQVMQPAVKPELVKDFGGGKDTGGERDQWQGGGAPKPPVVDFKPAPAALPVTHAKQPDPQSWVKKCNCDDLDKLNGKINYTDQVEAQKDAPSGGGRRNTF